MTNKQAQETINAIKFMLDNAQYSEDVEEALDMAINALTAQPETHEKRTETHACDLIDREAAVDAIYHHLPSVSRTRARTMLHEVPSVQPERTCVNCGRTVNNGGWYVNGRTRCPIEEHYALPKDGYCHLWEKRNVTDDDYPERREDERPES